MAYQEHYVKRSAVGLTGTLRLLKKAHLRCRLQDGKGYHLRTSKLNPLPPLLPGIWTFLSKPWPVACKSLQAV